MHSESRERGNLEETRRGVVESVFPSVARTLRSTESKAPFGIVSGRIREKYSGCLWENLANAGRRKSDFCPASPIVFFELMHHMLVLPAFV